ncbi:hypothetical protein EUGRSUZ_F01208 [Eucalyptus grandis]|uniref:Uncharacterized protein n=2 Tax=Eucalyptus grandis TaxID=71139 RepID=A0ACC3KFX1_EUCGR|nr:hypothetical protein EUGRSUZ_F01208 [Eucalyptus grandis]
MIPVCSSISRVRHRNTESPKSKSFLPFRPLLFLLHLPSIAVLRHPQFTHPPDRPTDRPTDQVPYEAKLQ